MFSCADQDAPPDARQDAAAADAESMDVFSMDSGVEDAAELDAPTNEDAGPIAETLKAFPSAYGGGSQVTGGRGYPAYFVDNLNEHGPGSLKQAVADAKANGGGNIIFNVSGVIRMDSSLSIQEVRNVSFLGQTAPLGGITITVDTATGSANKFTLVRSDNIVFRHIKFRPTLPSDNDVVDIISSTNIIFDHCSLSWGGDEGISTRVFGDGAGGWDPVNNISIQRNLIAECNTGSILGSQNDLSVSNNISLHQNLYYNISKRFSNMSTDNRLDIINNVVYNWSSLLSRFQYAPDVNLVNNYFATGLLNFTVTEDGSSKPLESMADENAGMQIYAAGNYIDKDIFTDPLADNRVLFYRWTPTDGYAQNEQVSDLSSFTETQHELIGDSLPVQSAMDAYADVTTDVGANAYLDDNGDPQRASDSVDTDYLTHVIDDTPEAYRGVDGNDYNYAFTTRYADFVSSITGTPLNSRPVDYDADGDGICDAWFAANVPSGSTALDTNATGYTYLEVFANQVDN